MIEEQYARRESTPIVRSLRSLGPATVSQGADSVGDAISRSVGDRLTIAKMDLYHLLTLHRMLVLVEKTMNDLSIRNGDDFACGDIG